MGPDELTEDEWDALDQLDIDEMLADEERHDAANLTAITWPERITVYPVEIDREIWE
jgi:hypothetical protein